MKKILCLVVALFMLVGCSCSNDKANDAVEKYLNQYKNLNDEVLTNIDELVNKENMTDEQKNSYKEILKRQYRDLNYTIENESYDGDKAYVTVKITVYDLYKSQKDAGKYLQEHQDEFKTDGVYDNVKYLEYRLNQMKENKDTIAFTIVFNVNKVDGKWQVEQPNEEVLEKIHGIYNYEEQE